MSEKLAKRTRAGTLATASLLLIGVAAAQSISQPAASGSESLGRGAAEIGPELRSTYRLGRQDQIVIHASDVPELSDKPLLLDLDGNINLPMVGAIHAEGLTPRQLEAELTKRLKVYLENPEVTVTVAEFRSQSVSVVGEVMKPGVEQVEGSKTLLDVLSMAGGARADAGPSVRITRSIEWGRIPLPNAAEDESGKFTVAEVELKALMDATNPEWNIVIRPSDVISIPRAEVVYVMGEVAKVGPLVLNTGHTISVLAAVSSSGGVTRTAATNRAMILRPIMGGPKRAELPFDLKKIMAGQANDLPLLAGDILFIPDSGRKRAQARAIEAAIQMGTMAGMYTALH